MQVFNLRFHLFGNYTTSVFLLCHLPKIKLARHCLSDAIFIHLLKVVGDCLDLCVIVMHAYKESDYVCREK